MSSKQLRLFFTLGLLVSFLGVCSTEPEPGTEPETDAETGDNVKEETEPETDTTAKEETEPETDDTVNEETEPETDDTAKEETEPETDDTAKEETEPETDDTAKEETEPETDDTAKEETEPESGTEPENGNDGESDGHDEPGPEQGNPEGESEPEGRPEPDTDEWVVGGGFDGTWWYPKADTTTTTQKTTRAETTQDADTAALSRAVANEENDIGLLLKVVLVCVGVACLGLATWLAWLLCSTGRFKSVEINGESLSNLEKTDSMKEVTIISQRNSPPPSYKMTSETTPPYSLFKT